MAELPKDNDPYGVLGFLFLVNKGRNEEKWAFKICRFYFISLCALCLRVKKGNHHEITKNTKTKEMNYWGFTSGLS